MKFFVQLGLSTNTLTALDKNLYAAATRTHQLNMMTTALRDALTPKL